VIAALVIGQRGRLPGRPLTAYYVAFGMSCLLMLGFGLVFDVWQALVISALVRAASATSNILWFTMEYRLVPREMLGRVGSLDWMVVLAGLPLSYALVGPLAELIGVRETLMATGALGALVMIVPIFIPGALTPERDGSLDEPPAIESAPSTAPV
jgi:hypothetical protein